MLQLILLIVLIIFVGGLFMARLEIMWDGVKGEFNRRKLDKGEYGLAIWFYREEQEFVLSVVLFKWIFEVSCHAKS